MPACDARYDVILTDGRCPGYQAGMPRAGDSPLTAVLDYDEERMPDEFGDPGRLLAAKYRRGIARTGAVVTECRIGRKTRVLFWVGGKGDHHRVQYHARRYLRWQGDEPYDPCIDDDPDFFANQQSADV